MLKSQTVNNTFNQTDRSYGVAGEKSFYEILSSESCDSFVNYIGWLGFTNDPNTVILSSKHHFYYDPEELTNVSTIINLKELNQIKQIKNFLLSVRAALQRSSNFIGYFTDNKKNKSLMSGVNSSYSNAFEFMSSNSFLNMIYNLTDPRTNKFMSKKNVHMLLEEFGFKVLDMTELNGVTYFHAQVA